MLLGTDTAARRIWLDSSYLSSFGKPAISSYIVVASSIALCQTSNSLKDFAGPLLSTLHFTFQATN
jgi:hypothetical protein